MMVPQLGVVAKSVLFGSASMKAGYWSAAMGGPWYCGAPGSQYSAETAHLLLHIPVAGLQGLPGHV